MKDEIRNIESFRYIGETGKSSYERGRQHLFDAAQMKPGSHISKHYIDVHENEKIDDLRFGIKIRSTARTAFERQVGESVLTWCPLIDYCKLL